MPELLRMPEVAAGAETAVLCDWVVMANETYAAGDVLATIETDKAVVDFAADAAGVLLRTLVAPGTEARVGSPIALVADLDEKVEDIEATLVALGSAPRQSVVPSEPPIGLPLAAPNATEPSLETSPLADVGKIAAGTLLQKEQQARIFASPLARRLAHESGIDTASLVGTGPNGRIIRRDVELALANVPHKDSTSGTSEPKPVPGVSPTAPLALVGSDPARTGSSAPDRWVDTPHSRVRRAIAQRLAESKQTIPHFYLRGSARMDELLDLRARLNETSPSRISVNDFVIKAAACAHLVVPAMNVIWSEEYVRRMPTVDIGSAVATAKGLVTPVLRDVARMPIGVVAATTGDFGERAREGRLYQHELEGGTATVTNLGMYGTEEFAAIINPPQSSILAVGAVRKEAVVTKKGKLRARSMIHVCLSVDHRPIDGTVAAEWMRAFLEILENPVRVLV
jgi:pyruvate dehydrogenase E2 component (dihydrolipoamide acetyltransferase)